MGSGGGDTVSVAVTLSRDDGIQVDGASVLASDSAGNAVGTLGTTGVNGTATMDVPIGGRVTVFYEDTANDYAYSAEVTAATKAIKWLHRKEVASTVAAHNVDMSVSCPTCPTGGLVIFSLPCGSATAQKSSGSSTVSATLTNYEPCPGLTELTGYAVGYDLTGNVIAKSSAVGWDPSSADVPLVPMSTAVAPVPFSLAISGLPPSPATVSSLQSHDASGISYSLDFSNAAPFATIESSFAPDLDLVTLVTAPSLYTAFFFSRRFPAFSGADVTFSASLAGTSAPSTFDGTQVAYEISGGAAGDAISIRLRSGAVVWTLVAPGAMTGAITVPKLPGSLMQWKVPATATVSTENIDSLGAADYVGLLKHQVAGNTVDTRDDAGVRWTTDRSFLDF